MSVEDQMWQKIEDQQAEREKDLYDTIEEDSIRTFKQIIIEFFQLNAQELLAQKLNIGLFLIEVYVDDGVTSNRSPDRSVKINFKAVEEPKQSLAHKTIFQKSITCEVKAKQKPNTTGMFYTRLRIQQSMNRFFKSDDFETIISKNGLSGIYIKLNGSRKKIQIGE